MCIDFSVRKHRKVNAERNLLTKKLIRVKNALHSGDPDFAPIVKNLECALSSLLAKEAEGAKIRSKAQWIEENEKSTQFFIRLENKHAGQNCFDSLVDTNGVEKYLQDELEAIVVNFYESLFSKDYIDLQIQTELIDDLELSLTDSKREQCEGLFTKEELLTTLRALQTGKSPGCDGLPTELYLYIWDSLGDLLVLLFNECFRIGSLTDSQRDASLQLNHKKDDRNLIKNWHPITLLNTDYKLASKVITERLKLVMSSIVRQDQTCGVVG